MEHRLEPSHELRLEFRLSPQLLETLKILQMPKLDLKQFIQSKLEENPFIERDEEPDESEISFEEEIEEELFSYPISFSIESTPLEEREMLIGTEKTLKEHLKEQLHLSANSQKEIEIGEFIIDSLDDDGFLKLSVKEIADKFKVKPEEVEKIRKNSFRSHIGAKFREIDIPIVDKIIDDLARENIHTKIPASVRGYLQDLWITMCEINKVLRKGGKCVVVIGNACFPNLTVDVDVALAKMAMELGFKPEIRVGNVRWCDVNIPKQRPVRESIVIMHKLS